MIIIGLVYCVFDRACCSPWLSCIDSSLSLMFLWLGGEGKRWRDLEFSKRALRYSATMSIETPRIRVSQLNHELSIDLSHAKRALLMLHGKQCSKTHPVASTIATRKECVVLIKNVARRSNFAPSQATRLPDAHKIDSANRCKKKESPNAHTHQTAFFLDFSMQHFSLQQATTNLNSFVGFLCAQCVQQLSIWVKNNLEAHSWSFSCLHSTDLKGQCPSWQK